MDRVLHLLGCGDRDAKNTRLSEQEVVELLGLLPKTTPDWKDHRVSQKRTLLWLAIMRRDKRIVEGMLQMGFDANVQGAQGGTKTHLEAARNQAKIKNRPEDSRAVLKLIKNAVDGM